ncbi:MAG TPA: nucleotide exchange factor GrpE [Candidatus Binataceae bacterium]|jgi:molecular chaperone GrpE|nr:nucleotide exchange factor GrpE [Candidatus Binataceae bacterium]
MSRNKEHPDGKNGPGEARHDHPHHHKADAQKAEAAEATPTDEMKGTAEGAAPETPITIEAAQAQLAEKDREIAELKDKYLRALADFENARKRIRQQSEESVRLQRENLLRDLLPIIDNLERAVSAAQGGRDGQAIVEGVQMVLASLLDYLRVQGVTPIAAKGMLFDPRLHEAVDHVESPDHEPNMIVDEMHRGYAAGERILRPARVSVAKGTFKPGEGDDRGNGQNSGGN